MFAGDSTDNSSQATIDYHSSDDDDLPDGDFFQKALSKIMRTQNRTEVEEDSKDSYACLLYSRINSMPTTTVIYIVTIGTLIKMYAMRRGCLKLLEIDLKLLKINWFLSC